MSLTTTQLTLTTCRHNFIFFQTYTLTLHIHPIHSSNFTYRTETLTHPCEMDSLCEMCENAANMTCFECENSRYCSKDCQKRGWHKHKILCRSFRDFSDSARPSPLHTRAICFPVNATSPHFIWLPFEQHHLGDTCKDDNHYPVRGNLLGRLDTATECASTDYNIVLDRQLMYTITFMVRKSALRDGSKVNESVKNVLDGKYEWLFDCRGPMIAYARFGPPYQCHDLNMTYFRHLVDILTTFLFSGTSTELKELRAIDTKPENTATEISSTREHSTKIQAPHSPKKQDSHLLEAQNSCSM